MDEKIKAAANLVRRSKMTIAFTGAGISVESGIPPFRGENGLWNKYDPRVLELDYFYSNPERCWYFIKEIFYDFFGKAEPNDAHRVLARMEKENFLHAIVTQNIDNLHQLAGSKEVYAFHGNSSRLVCTRCSYKVQADEIDLEKLPPRCPTDHTILKPDFIFFGEGIPVYYYEKSFEAARKCEVCIIIGSTGEVAPASYIPHTAKQNRAFIIEINPDQSLFTKTVTDLHLKGKASEILLELGKQLFE